MFGLILELLMVAFVLWLIMNLVHYFLSTEAAHGGFFFLSKKMSQKKGSENAK